MPAVNIFYVYRTESEVMNTGYKERKDVTINSRSHCDAKHCNVLMKNTT
jgi:hypothetical protein